jgi:hypothetical protein
VFLFGQGWITGSALHNEFPVSDGVGWRSVFETIRSFPVETGLTLTGYGPLIAYGVALAAIVTTAAVQFWRKRRLDPTSRVSTLYLKVLLSLWLVFLFALPTWWRGEPISVRVPSLVALLLLWLPPMWSPRTEREARWLVAPRLIILAAALFSLGWAHVRFAQYQRTMAPMDRVIALLPRGSRVATLVYETVPTGIVSLPTYVHVGGYPLAARGGLASFGFARVGLAYLPNVPRNLLLYRDVWRPSYGWQLTPQHSMLYDYVLVKTGARYPHSPFAGKQDLARLVFSEGEFELWEVVKHTPR